MKTKKIPLSEQLKNLQERCVKLEHENLSLQARETSMLEAFSRIIKNADTDDYEGYAFNRKPNSKTYKTWMEVTADVGKLLAKDNYADIKMDNARKDDVIKELQKQLQAKTLE